VAHSHRDDMELDEHAVEPVLEPVIPAPPVVSNAEVAAVAAAQRATPKRDDELAPPVVERERAFTVGDDDPHARRAAAPAVLADDDPALGSLTVARRGPPRSIAPDFTDAATWLARRD
jgi:hypothetical protein